MTWLPTATDTPTAFEGVLGLRPELLQLQKEFYGRLWEAEPALNGVLELCRLRIAQLHDCAAEFGIRHAGTGVKEEMIAALDKWRGASCFSDVERAAFNLAERLPWQVHEITDADVAALRGRLSDPQIVTLLLALVLFDMHCRLRLVLGIAPHPGVVEVPTSTSGVLW